MQLCPGAAWAGVQPARHPAVPSRQALPSCSQLEQRGMPSVVTTLTTIIVARASHTSGAHMLPQWAREQGERWVLHGFS